MDTKNTNKKIIVFVLPALIAGGAERVLITLMNGLDRNRFSPIFITVNKQGPMKDLIAPDIPFHALTENTSAGHGLPKLYKKLRELKPDIIISTMAPMNFAILLLKPFFPRTRFIVREAITPSFLLKRSSFSPLIKLAYRFLYPKADLVISPAQIIIDEFSNTLNLDTKKHRLLKNPVSIDQLRTGENIKRKITEDRKITTHFVCAGRLHEQKGFDRLIKALSDLPKNMKWHLTILGEGEQREKLELLIKKYGFEKQISLPGLTHTPWPDIAAADAFLLPSRWEGLPNVVLESLAVGTPVIATKESGGIAEISALAQEHSVTVTNNMTEFVQNMAKVKPQPKEIFRPSLLPSAYNREKIIESFTDMLST